MEDDFWLGEFRGLKSWFCCCCCTMTGAEGASWLDDCACAPCTGASNKCGVWADRLLCSGLKLVPLFMRAMLPFFPFDIVSLLGVGWPASPSGSFLWSWSPPSPERKKCIIYQIRSHWACISGVTSWSYLLTRNTSY